MGHSSNIATAKAEDPYRRGLNGELMGRRAPEESHLISLTRRRPSFRVRWFLRSILRIELVVAAAVLATGLAIKFEGPLTSHSMRISAADAGRAFNSYSYDDQNNGGTSEVIEKSPLDWTCSLNAAYEHRYCGFGLMFDPNHQGRTLDLSKFESLRIKFRYEGGGNSLRIILKDHDPRFKGTDGSLLDKVNQTTVSIGRGEQVVTLEFPDFNVAEWWKDQTGATGERARPSLGHVTAAEFITGLNSPAGTHRVKVVELSFTRKFVSTEVWYSGIVAFWLLLVGWFLLQRKRHAQRLHRELEDRFKTTLDTIPQMVWSQDESGNLHLNGRWEQFTGTSIGQTAQSAFWQLIHPDERQHALDEWDHSLTTGDPFELEFRLTHCSGGYRWVLARAVAASDETRRAGRWYGTCTDVHDRVVAQRALTESITGERRKALELKWASEHDALTSLPNRRAFQARLEAATLKAIASGGQVGLLLLDMDHFKHTNDSLGHSAGDELLKAVAVQLTSALRNDDLVARIGGDEFAVVLDPVGSDQDLIALCDKIIDSIRQPIQIAGRTINPAASIGGAIFPKDAETADDLFKASDTALYALKRSGRGGVKLFHSAMLDEAKRAASQLGRARHAINEGSLFPVYQPKVSLSTGDIVGFEALLRWNHPTKGLQHPASLDEAFKDYELAARIGEQMQRLVAADIRRWADQGVPIDRIAINASPAEFLRDDYAQRLCSILAEHNVSPTSIEIEITEQAFVDRSRDHVSRALTHLRDVGIAVSLDDFGTGCSSLSHLRDFPVDLLKIDQSFVQQMTIDPEIASIVTAVVNLAHSIGISVVAEGVEQPVQRDMLQMIGCQFAQGHLFSKAVDAADVPTVLTLLKAA